MKSLETASAVPLSKLASSVHDIAPRASCGALTRKQRLTITARPSPLPGSPLSPLPAPLSTRLAPHPAVGNQRPATERTTLKLLPPASSGGANNIEVIAGHCGLQQPAWQYPSPSTARPSFPAPLDSASPSPRPILQSRLLGLDFVFFANLEQIEIMIDQI